MMKTEFGSSAVSDLLKKSSQTILSKIVLIDEKNSFIMRDNSIKKFQKLKKFSEPLTERSDDFEGNVS